MIAHNFIKEGYPVSLVLRLCKIARSSYYYQPNSSGGKKGRQKSEYTFNLQGKKIPNQQVIKDIEICLSREFVDYGYLKVTHWLRQQKQYIINPKKTYRLMAEQGWLNTIVAPKKSRRNWVKELLPVTKKAFDYLEFDLKYIYVAGKNRNALLLSIIDVRSRWVLAQYLHWQIKQDQVISLFDQIFEVYPLPKHFYVRNDNGSQFEAQKVQQYFQKMGVSQEFCKPATPEQNAHIESYHSILERVICQQYEFMDLKELQNTMDRFIEFYNFERIHSGIGYISPYYYLLKENINMKQYQLENALKSNAA